MEFLDNVYFFVEKQLNYIFSDRRFGNLIIFLFSSIIVGFISLQSGKLDSHNDSFYSPADHHKYIYMAEHPFSFYIAPFSRRIFVPFLVYLTHLPIELGFYLISYFSFCFSALLVFLILRKLDFSFVLCLTGWLSFLTLKWIVAFNVFDFWLPDSFLFLIILIFFYLSIEFKEKPTNLTFIMLILVSLIGILTKESFLLISPSFYALCSEKLIDKKTFQKFLIIILPSIFVFILLIIFIPAKNSNLNYVNSLPISLTYVSFKSSDYNYFSLIPKVLDLRIKTLLSNPIREILAVYSVGIFGTLMIFFSIYYFVKKRIILLKILPVLILDVLQLLIAVNTERILIIIFPIIIISSIKGVEIYSKDFKFFEIISLFLAILQFLILNINFYFQILLILILLLFSFFFKKLISRKTENFDLNHKKFS